jgi:hypothetical protein
VLPQRWAERGGFLLTFGRNALDLGLSRALVVSC